MKEYDHERIMSVHSAAAHSVDVPLLDYSLLFDLSIPRSLVRYRQHNVWNVDESHSYHFSYKNQSVSGPSTLLASNTFGTQTKSIQVFLSRHHLRRMRSHLCVCLSYNTCITEVHHKATIQ